MEKYEYTQKNILLNQQNYFNFSIYFTTFKVFCLLAGHKVHFIPPCGEKKSNFRPLSRKKIVCNTEKTLILLV